MPAFSRWLSKRSAGNGATKWCKSESAHGRGDRRGGLRDWREHSRSERQNGEHLPKGVLEGLLVYDCIRLEASARALLAQDLP